MFNDQRQIAAQLVQAMPLVQRCSVLNEQCDLIAPHRDLGSVVQYDPQCFSLHLQKKCFDATPQHGSLQVQDNAFQFEHMLVDGHMVDMSGAAR